jgi:spore coat polysaccharide biosynthesis protein SpsF
MCAYSLFVASFMNAQVGIVIQARMGSSRLPGKVLLPINGRPLLGHVVGRLSELKAKASLIVATSNLPADDVIVGWCEYSGVMAFRGGELDVLQRYLDCASHFDLSHVVRLTADNPFTDIEELDRLISLHLANSNEYSHSFGQLPIGAGAEVFAREALEKSCKLGRGPHHREHVNEYILENLDSFRVGVLEIPENKRAPTLRLTIDTPDEYELACRIVKHFAETGNRTWTPIEEVINFVCTLRGSLSLNRYGPLVSGIDPCGRT